MKGLLEYLAGPGKANEHMNPRLVAGDPSLLPWLGDRKLDMVAARQVAARVDQPRRLLGVEVPRGSVWHCSLSVRADDKAISDKKWLAISREFVAEMGFTGGGKAGCRWVAVHHGKSKEGNDHVHIAVCLVREDGTIASTWKDYAKAQKIAGQLEKKHGLAVLASRGAGRGDRGVRPAEVAKAQRVGAVEPERTSLERAVRACAAAAAGEGDFLARVRGEGLVVRARFAAGGVEQVVGYSVAVRPEPGAGPVWFGGGRLAKDLTLPRLRASWPRGGEEAGVAASEWAALSWGVSPGPLAPVQGGQAGWAGAAREVGALAQEMRAFPLNVATWAHVAHQGAGVYAAWSRAVEATPGPLADTSRRLAHQASINARRARMGPRHTRPAAKTFSGSGRSAAALLAAAARGGVSQEVLAAQVADLVAALVDLSAAMHQARQAQAEARKIQELLRASRPTRPGATLSPQQLAAATTRPAYLRHSSPQTERGRGFGR